MRINAVAFMLVGLASMGSAVEVPKGCITGTGVPVVLVPGLFASTLRNSSGSLVYGDGMEMLTGIGGNDVLKLEWNWTTPTNPGELPKQILNNKLVPGEPIYELSYGSIRYPQYIYLKNAFVNQGRTFCGLAYDWRLPGLDNIAHIQSYILNVSSAYNSTVHVMGHSLGGILAYGAVQQSAAVRAVTHSTLFISAPFVYQAYTLTHLAKGEVLVYNLNFESRDVVFTLPYNYGLVSTEREFARFNDTMCGLYSNGHLITRNYHNLTTLKEYKLGPYYNKNLTAQEEQHVKNSFAVAKAFRDSLQPASNLTFPPTAVLVGNTNTGCSYDVSSDGVVGKARSYEPGDGVVLKKYAMPEVPVQNTYVGTPFTNHVLLAWDTDQILGILQDLGVPNVGNGPGTGNQDNAGMNVGVSAALTLLVALWAGW